MSALRVLHVVPSINRDIGGPAITVPALAHALVAAGAECTLASLDYARHGPRPSLGDVREVTMSAGAVARALRGWSPSFSRTLRRVARDSADVVHGNGLWMFPNLYARKAAVAAGVPLIVSPRGMLDAWSLRRGSGRKAIAWRAFEGENLRSAALFHATSEAEAEALRLLGLRKPVAVIPNGVALPDLGNLAGRELLEKDFPDLSGKRWVLFLSRLHPKKGVSELLSAWRAIEGAHTDWQLVLAGPDLDGYGERMRLLSSELGLENRVTFTGMLSGRAKESALGNADLFVLPTHSENFGIAVAEALAHGVPAITTRSAPWALLQEERCGWWIGPEASELEFALRSAIGLAASELKAMGARGRAAVSRDNSWDHAGRQMLSVYQWLRGKAARPDCVML